MQAGSDVGAPPFLVDATARFTIGIHDTDREAPGHGCLNLCAAERPRSLAAAVSELRTTSSAFPDAVGCSGGSARYRPLLVTPSVRAGHAPLLPRCPMSGSA